MRFTAILLFALSTLFWSCGPSPSEVEEIKNIAFEKGKNIGLIQGYTNGQKQGYNQGFEEGKIKGLDEGIQRGIAKGRQDRFIEVVIIGIKKLYPESIVFGVYIFITLFTFSILWKAVSPRLINYLATNLKEFRWSMIQRMRLKNKYKIQKERWDEKLNYVIAKTSMAEKEIESYKMQIEKINDFILLGIPNEQVTHEKKTIARLYAKIKTIEQEVIKNGENHKATIGRIMRGIDLIIFKIQHGSQFDSEETTIDFFDIQEDIRLYLKFDVGDFSDYVANEYNFSAS